MSKIYIETPRLLLREWQTEDIQRFTKMNADPEVMRYFPSTLNQEETELFYDKIQQEFSEYDYGLYATEEKSSGLFIGFIGFHWARMNVDFCPCIEIGWRLDKTFWNKGYATEGAKACLDYGFNHLSFDEVYSFTSEINTPSQNVMQKIGMELYCHFEHPNVQEGNSLKPHICYKSVR